MGDLQAEIQAVLREMQGGGHEMDLADVKNHPSVPVSQSCCTSSRLQEQYARNPKDLASHTYKQQPLYQSQAALPSDSFLSSQQNIDLDAYGWFSVFPLSHVNLHVD